MENKTTIAVITAEKRNQTQNVTELIECQYQTVTVRKIREEVVTTTSNVNKVEDLLKKIVPTKSFLYRHHGPIKKLDKTPTSYVPMDVGRKPRRFFRLSYDYPHFDFSRFRFSKQDNQNCNYNDRGYYSIKTTTTNKKNTKIYKNVESRTKYKSFSNSDDFNEIVLEDHFYEDLCYNDVDERKRSHSTTQINNIKSTAIVKIQGMFHSFKLPSFFKKDDVKDIKKEPWKEVDLYENDQIENGSMYDSVIVKTNEVGANDTVQSSKAVVEEYLEPIHLNKDYCDVTFEGRDESFLGYVLSIFENTFGMRRVSSDQNISEHSEIKSARVTDNGASPTEKRKDHRKSSKTNMADRPLPVPVDNEPYYMNIDRMKAELYLNGQPDGTFILRPSSQPNHAYTLSVVCSNAVHNIGVRRRPDGKLALGFARRGERHFASVAALLRFHRRRRLLLVGSNGVIGATTLKEPPVYYSTPSGIPVRGVETA